MIRKERFYFQNDEIIFLKIKEKFNYKTQTPHEGKVCNSDYTDFLLHPLHPFADLSIGEAVGTPPLDPFFFFQVHSVLLMSRRSNDPSNNRGKVSKHHP